MVSKCHAETSSSVIEIVKSYLDQIGKDDVSEWHLTSMKLNPYYNFSENCLIGFDGVLKLGDFGFARSVEGESLSRTFCGSTVYAAPEILTAKNEYDPRYSDTWSCGIVLYAMFTAKMPFGRDLLNKFVKLKIVEGKNYTEQVPVVHSNVAHQYINTIGVHQKSIFEPM